MSKFIRIKDGIIVDTTKYKHIVERTFRDKVVAIDLNHWGQDNDKYPTWIEVEDIIKQSDSIEELCDEFVLIQKVNNENHYTILIPNEEDKGKELKYAYVRNAKNNWYCSVIDYIKAKDIIYGAIWTDKGLIYVAKMNDKGELELL